MATVELRNLTKRYGDNAVVDRVSLHIEHGKLVCLLGPSGCGKTTTLRLIAGFVEPTEGEILVGERVVSSRSSTVPPERRNMSMIFQSYALWPHMTVRENIAYGLKLRKMSRDVIAKKLDAILGTTKLAELADLRSKVVALTMELDAAIGERERLWHMLSGTLGRLLPPASDQVAQAPAARSEAVASTMSRRWRELWRR